MKSNQDETLYEHLLQKTKGNLTNHTVTYQLKELKPDTKISLNITEGITGVCTTDGEPEIIENGKFLLAGQPMTFNQVHVNPQRINPLDGEHATISSFTVKDKDYYISSNDGMFLEIIKISMKELIIKKNKNLTQRRIEKVMLFFSDHKQRHGLNKTNQEIYKIIGEPTKKALWNEWFRLYPEDFVEKFQGKFFESPDFPKITFKEGNSERRKVIAPEHQL